MGKHSSIGVFIAAVICTAMAAIHGVMGEALFKLLGGAEAGISLLVAAMLLFMAFALIFWERDRIGKWWQRKPSEHPLHWHALLGALVLFTLTMLAQGVLAFSTAHLVADMTHDAYLWMVLGGAILFLGATLWLWSKRDKLFVIKGKVAPVELTGEPLQVVVAFLSTPGLGSEAEYAIDKKSFRAAKQTFDECLERGGWDKAMEAICNPEAKFEQTSFWNIQMPLRLMSSLANAPAIGGRERLMVFITTPESERRWRNTSALLCHIAALQPVDQKVSVLHLREVLFCQHEEDCQLKKEQFDKNLGLIYRALNALRARGHDPRTIAVDATSSTVEASVVGAMATINSSTTFIYVNTNDGVVRRFDANASGAWVAE